MKRPWSIPIAQIVLGRRLANREAESRKIGAFEGVPSMGLDGLASSAYGPEAALTVLMPLGAAGLYWFSAVMTPIIVLLGILFFSYWQTIRAYPANGGAYSVARENLGTQAGLLAAAALMVDYMLNVAVGISAGVAALISAVAPLQEHQLALCLGVLALITLLNLRGTLDSGRVLALPAYLFVACFIAVIALGFYRAHAAGGHPHPLIAAPPFAAPAQTVSVWLLLRAVASGCTAMTGVEAVSNGIGEFRAPARRHAHRTLAAIVAILALLLIGIAWLAPAYGIAAMDQTSAGYQSVLSQLTAAIAGRGVFYHVAMAAALCVLVLSANTSFVAFPRLSRVVAQDRYLPEAFAQAGRRLVFTVSIVSLAACAALLLIVFEGITDALIPLFAIGAFSSFALSQAAMVMHWRRKLRHLRGARRGSMRERLRWRSRIGLLVNAMGAAATIVALLVIIAAKFSEGAWITLLIIALLIALLRTIRGYYAALDRRASRSVPLQFADVQPPIVLVTVEDLNDLSLRGIAFGMSVSSDVVGLHLSQLRGPDSQQRERELRQRWEAWVETPARAAQRAPPRLMVMPAQRRMLHESVLRVVRKIEEEFPARRIAVLIPELVKRHWYQYFLHTHRAHRLRRQLLRHGDARLTVVSVPWRMDEPPPERAQRTAHTDRELNRRRGSAAAARAGRYDVRKAQGGGR